MDAESTSGIPRVPFAEDDDALVRGVLSCFSELVSAPEKAPAPAQALSALQALLERYRSMEARLSARHARNSATIGDLVRAQDAIRTLVAARADVEVRFELGDTLYCPAVVAPRTESAPVVLWLGAGVLVEYAPDDALAFLETRIGERRDDAARCASELDFLRRQSTVAEVSIARIYNRIVRARGASAPGSVH